MKSKFFLKRSVLLFSTVLVFALAFSLVLASCDDNPGESNIVAEGTVGLTSVEISGEDVYLLTGTFDSPVYTKVTDNGVDGDYDSLIIYIAFSQSNFFSPEPLADYISGQPVVNIKNGKLTLEFGEPKELQLVSDFISQIKTEGPGSTAAATPESGIKHLNLWRSYFLKDEEADFEAFLGCYLENDPRYFVRLWYADKPVKFTGRVVSIAFPGMANEYEYYTDYDFELKKGWNYIKTRGSMNNPEGESWDGSMENLQPGDKLMWVVEKRP